MPTWAKSGIRSMPRANIRFPKLLAITAMVMKMMVFIRRCWSCACEVVTVIRCARYCGRLLMDARYIPCRQNPLEYGDWVAEQGCFSMDSDAAHGRHAFCTK